MIIAFEKFRDEELLEPKSVLENAGVEVMIASNKTGTASGMLGAQVGVETFYTDINIEDYDGIVFVGGSGASIYFNDEKAQELTQKAYEQDKVVGAICIAPSILAHAGLLQNKKGTCFSSQEEDLKSHGAEYTGESVTIDGKIVTANGPGAAREFGEAIISSLS